MQQLQAAMQPEQDYFGEEAPQQEGQTAQEGQQAAQVPAQAQTVAQEEEAKKQARAETMTGILQREATRQGMRSPGTQLLGEMAKVYEPGTSGQAYARAALEAYQAGLDGQSYADARTQAQKAATLSAEQFRTAWQQGQKERARQSPTGASATAPSGEGRTRATEGVGPYSEQDRQAGKDAGQAEDVEVMLAGLGGQAAEAAQAIEEGQDPGDYAAAMQEAVTVYAAAGADLRGAVAQARSGERKSVLGILTDSQVELAERLGQQRQTVSREQAQQKGEQRRQKRTEQQIRQRQQQRQDLLTKQYGDELSDEEVDRQMEADSQEYERLSEQIRQLESGARVPGSTQRQEGRASYADKAGSVDGARYVPVDQDGLSKAQKATVKIAEAIARTTGLEIRLVRFIGSVGGAYLRGQGGVIYLDPTASYGGRSVAVGSFCHELTHWLQEYAPEEYQQLKEVVLREIGKDPKAFRVIFNERRNTQTDLRPDELTDEMVANACQTILMDQEAVRRVAQENRSLFERIRDIILDLAEQFKAAFAEIDTAGDFPLYKEVRAAHSAMEEIRQIWLNAFDVATENLQAERAAEQNKTAAQEGDGAQMMIMYTNGGRPVVVINKDILSGVQESQWKATTLSALRRFSNGVPVYGKIIRINQHTRREYLNSQNTRYYEKKDRTKFADKLRAANNADEIIIATTDYVNEGLNHERKDQIVDMARGKVLMRIGQNDYEADVLIGYTSGDALVLHDVEKLSETDVIKKAGLRSPGHRENGVKPGSNNPTAGKVSQDAKKVKPQQQTWSDEAKINIGAAGDFVTLVGGARIDKVDVPKKKYNNDAKKGVSNFDYALKNVEIDGKRFQVVVNIRKTPGRKYIYEVKLRPIKKNSSFGPQPGNAQRRPARQKPLHRSSSRTIPQTGGESKENFRLA